MVDKIKNASLTVESNLYIKFDQIRI